MKSAFSSKWMRLGGIVAAVAISASVLASCYLPNLFVSEIRLGRTGDFALYYKGDLTWAPLFRDIKIGEVPESEIPGRIERIRADLARDGFFKSIQSRGNGVFAVEYERQGHLGPSEQATFIRRNAVILMIKSYPDGRISVTGNGAKPADIQLATELGLDVRGEFRITTDALVLEHNATTVTSVNGYPVYIWKIESAYALSPRFVMRRDGVYPQ